MSEEKLYLFCYRYSFAFDWSLGLREGHPVGITKRYLVDGEVGRSLEKGILQEVSAKEFVSDMKNGVSESKYLKMLGWNYGRAAEMMEVDRRLFLLIHPCCEARPYSYRQCRDDDEYALQLVRDIYSMRGGRIHIEEFDPEKHVLGYKPKIER